MKKLLLIPILVLAVSLVLPISAAATYPLTIDLVAGQDTENPIGYVEVWNTETHLRVRYMIDDPCWEIVETHLAVATSLAGIPTNKKGNPRIGHFPYSSLVDYSIPLTDGDPDWTPGTGLVIAAHAVVNNTCGGCQEETAWGMGYYCGPNRSTPFTENGGSWAEYFPYVVH